MEVTEDVFELPASIVFDEANKIQTIKGSDGVHSGCLIFENHINDNHI